jgi:hypothetical protein
MCKTESVCERERSARPPKPREGWLAACLVINTRRASSYPCKEKGAKSIRTKSYPRGGQFLFLLKWRHEKKTF